MDTVFDIVIGAGPTRVELLTANIGAPLSVAFVALGTGALMLVLSSGSAQFALNLSRIFQSLKIARFYLLGLVRVKRNKPWGKVIDGLTGRSIPLATVRVYSTEFKKLLDAHLTDEDGRFDALALPGEYYVEVSKNGYQKFQSDIIKISSADQVLNVEISMLPSASVLGLGYLRQLNVIQMAKHLMQLLTPLLLIIGTITSFIVMIVLPSAFNYLIFGLYLVLDAIQVYFMHFFKKPFGVVADFSSQEPLPLSVVRIFDVDKNWLLDTKVTDRIGRFYFLLVPGNYYLTCAKSGYAPFRSDQIVVVKEGVVNFDIKMKKAR